MFLLHIQAGLISRAVPFEQWEPDMNSDEETEEGGHMQQNLAPLQLSILYCYTNITQIVLTFHVIMSNTFSTDSVWKPGFIELYQTYFTLCA